MSLETAPVSVLLRAIALLLMLLGAPARAWRRFAGWSDAKLTVLERALELRLRRGLLLRYAGEDDATVQKRLDLIAWFHENPRKAIRHLGRLARAGYRIFPRTPGFGLRFAPPAGWPASEPAADGVAGPDVVTPDSS